jgi:hypothetical protein
LRASMQMSGWSQNSPSIQVRMNVTSSSIALP